MPKKPNARTFGQDLMRGEHVVGQGKGKRSTKFGNDTAQTEDLRGGLTHRTTTDPYRAKKGKGGRMAPVAVPGGPTGPNSAYKRGRGAKPDIKGGLTQHAHIHKYDGQEGGEASASGTSIFDPTLCELVYRWFCPPGGCVLDPFAGGSVRGIVASRLGRGYVGVELRPEQIVANRAQLGLCDKRYKPDWREGDARDVASIAKDVHADLIFSCPPYWNLEVYSEDERDLSTFSEAKFFEAQAQIIRDALARLKPDRFAVWVVGDVRDKDGHYVNLPGRTVEAFRAAGAHLYNEMILVTAVGSLPVRVGKQFTSGRKVGKTHQNVLCFVKGDWRKAVKACGTVEFGDIAAVMEAYGEPTKEAPASPRPAPTAPPQKASAANPGAPKGVERFGVPL